MASVVAHTDLEEWLRAIPWPKVLHPRASQSPRVVHPYDALLEGTILDPTDRSADAGARGSTLEDGLLGRAAGGRPRSGSRKRAYNRKRAYGPKSGFDSTYAYRGERPS